MLTASLRDLQWRKRRFVIAIIGTGLVFAMTLVLTGLANGFRVEAERSVDGLGFDAYMVKSGAAGPFIGATAFAQTEVGKLSGIQGVTDAVPLVFGPTTIHEGGTSKNAPVFGAAGHPGLPIVSSGRLPSTPTEVAVSSKAGPGVGDDIQIGTRTMRIVGIVDDATLLAGQPSTFMTVVGAQQLLYSGQQLISSIGIRGTPAQAPDGYHFVDRAAAVDDLLRPMKGAQQAIALVAGLLWLVGALIVGSMIYVSSLERVRDFAVFKAVGVKTPAIVAGLALQAVVVALLAALVGGVLSLILGPLFPMTVDIPLSAFLLLPVLATAIGLLASVAGLRRAVTVDPALAFGGP